MACKTQNLSIFSIIPGRIVNRFSSDLYTVDDSLPFILNIFLAQVVGVIGPIVVTVYAVPWIIIGNKQSIDFCLPYYERHRSSYKMTLNKW